jgi:hypothetical protein
MPLPCGHTAGGITAASQLPPTISVCPAAPHLRNSLVKQMSLAHIVHLFLLWVCSVQKKDSGSSAHGSPGSSYVLHAGTHSSTQVSNLNQLWQKGLLAYKGTQAEPKSVPVWLVALQTHALHTPSFVQLVGNLLRHRVHSLPVVCAPSSLTGSNKGPLAIG